MQFGFQRLLEKISDLALSGGATNIQGEAGPLSCSALRPQKRRPNLRAIAMGQHNPITGADQADDLARGALGVCPLLGDRSLFSRANQGVPADGKEDGLHKKWLAASSEGLGALVLISQLLAASH